MCILVPQNANERMVRTKFLFGTYQIIHIFLRPILGVDLLIAWNSPVNFTSALSIFSGHNGVV